MSGAKNHPKKSGKASKAVAHERHNFAPSTLQRLRDRAGNVCSFPDCHVHTHGSALTGDKVANVGVACHIKAAAPGGPRYDGSQTKDERRHIDNAIWMCQSHSKQVDADSSAYSVETLLEWKQRAEARSNGLINKKSFTESEVKHAVEDGSVSILQRWVNKSNDPLDTPLAEVMKGYEAGLEALDPRFEVQVDKVGKSYHHKISALQDDVTIQLVLQDLDKLEGFFEAERALFEDGRQLEIPGAHVKFEGSKLFEAIHQKSSCSGQSVFTMGAPKRALTAYLYVRTPQGHDSVIDTFTCYYTSGSLRTVFDGVALGGFFVVKAACAHDGTGTKFDLSFNLEAWRGKNILDLPRFSRFAKAAQSFENGRLVVEIEVGDNVASFDTKSNSLNEKYHAQLSWLVEYLGLARKVAEQCTDAVILKDFDFDIETYSLLRKYNRFINGPVATTRVPGWLCSGKVDTFEKCDFSSFGGEAPPLIKISQKDSLTFELFGQAITAPRIETIYSEVDLVFYSDLDSRDQPKIELHTTAGTAITMQLQAGDSWAVGEDLSVFDEARSLPN